MTRSKIVESLPVDYKDEIIVMSSPGLVYVLIFKYKTNELIGVQKVVTRMKLTSDILPSQSLKLSKTFSVTRTCIRQKKLNYMETTSQFYFSKNSEIHITNIFRKFTCDESNREIRYKYYCKKIYSSTNRACCFDSTKTVYQAIVRLSC